MHPPAAVPKLLLRNEYRTPLRATGARLYYYDLDHNEQLPAAGATADFFFKPDTQDADATIGVVPYNGARFAPRELDVAPWRVDVRKLTSVGAFYSVPQGRDVPCITRSGKYCSFRLQLDAKRDFIVSFSVYEPLKPLDLAAFPPGLPRPRVLRRTRYGNVMTEGAKLYFYDLDKPDELTVQTSEADFFFMPDPETAGVIPYNGARFAAGSPDLYPWEVDPKEFSSAPNSKVPQRRNIPCVTSKGAWCTFSLRVDRGLFVISLALYEVKQP